MIDTSELAIRLKKHPNTIRKWARNGRIPVLNSGGSLLFIFEEVIEALSKKKK